MAEATSSSPVETRTADDGWSQVLTLPCELRVDLPVRGFHMRDLLRLARGSIIDSRWLISSGVPLSANGERIALGELESARGHLAFRLTEVT
jgi:flagellar motor switch/type III secretory pathway protein FliN